MVAWGCVADDLTGATDLATNLVARGFRTVVLFGASGDGLSTTPIAAIDEVDAIVVALKSRTAPVAEAVSSARAALRVLEAAGVERIYVKYCSTFDSTPQGNIGTTIDTVLAETGEALTVVVPSFPDTGRTVYQGHLFVGDQLLSDSPMRHHPLTPMRDSSVPRLLAPQTTADVAVIPLQVVRSGHAAVRSALDALRRPDGRVLVVIDALTVDDLSTIAAATSHLRVVTGASGLAQGFVGEHAEGDIRSIPVVDGRRVSLCGSVSQQSQKQVTAAHGHAPARKLDIERLRHSFEQAVAEVIDWALGAWASDVSATPLVYSADRPADVDTAPRSSGSAPASDLLERAFAAIARGLVSAGARQLIVAGGETAGSVVEGLGVRSLLIGPSIAPGVAWSAGALPDGTAVNLALKSGNFGGDDFFTSAWDVLDEARSKGQP
ncbi:four-carbon acid sugar kinase family protein [soil metagenome]